MATKLLKFVIYTEKWINALLVFHHNFVCERKKSGLKGFLFNIIFEYIRNYLIKSVSDIWN